MSTPTIPQSIIEVFDHQRQDLLLHLLKNSPEITTALVFVRQTSDVHSLNTALNAEGILSEGIHGNKKPLLRDRAIKALQEGKIRVIVVTEAYARNIDLGGEASAINFDFPELLPDYFKRVISRTDGKVITFANPKKQPGLVQLEELLETTLPRHPVEDFKFDTYARKLPASLKTASKGTSKKPLQNKKPKLKKKGR